MSPKAAGLLYNVGKAAGDLSNTPGGGNVNDAATFADGTAGGPFDLTDNAGLRNYIIARSTAGDPLSADGATV